jgi:hypothetical protein
MDEVRAEAHDHQLALFEVRPFVAKQADGHSKLAELFFWAKILLK